MKHFYCNFRVQHLNLHKNWHISFLLVAKSEILYITVISLRLCGFAYEYFVFLGRVTNPSAKSPFLEDALNYKH